MTGRDHKPDRSIKFRYFLQPSDPCPFTSRAPSSNLQVLISSYLGKVQINKHPVKTIPAVHCSCHFLWTGCWAQHSLNQVVHQRLCKMAAELRLLWRISFVPLAGQRPTGPAIYPEKILDHSDISAMKSGPCPGVQRQLCAWPRNASSSPCLCTACWIIPFASSS